MRQAVLPDEAQLEAGVLEQAAQPLLGVVTFSGEAQPRGPGLRLVLRPDGSLDGAESLVAALRA